MKNICRIFFTLLVIAICIGATSGAFAASTLTISAPDDWELFSWDDSLKIRWNSVTGASGYYVTIATSNNNVVTRYLVQNKYTSNTYFTATSYLPEEITQLKIWVGAVESSSDPATAAFTSDIVYMYLGHEPSLTRDGHDSITDCGATLQMTITRDNGYPIEDSGFYIGTGSSVSSMTKYSFKRYGSSNATDKGTKYMTLTSLEPGTKYYYRAYAVNEVGEDYTSYGSFTTTQGKLSDPRITSHPSSSTSYSGSAISLSWSSVSGADGYRYHIKQLSGQPDPDNNSEPGVNEWRNTTSSGTRSYTFPAANALPGYWYKFVIEAYADGAESGWSAPCYVYIEQGKLEDPVISSPDNTASYAGNQSITLKWGAVEGATGYHYYIKRLKGLPDRYNENEDAYASWDRATTSTSYTLSSSNVLPGYWYKFVVEATAPNVLSGWSQWVYCYIEEPALDDPSIVKPSAWSELYEGESVLVDWGSVSGADGYRCHIKQLAGRPDTGNNNELAVNTWRKDCGTSSQYTLSGSNVVGGYWYKFVAEAFNATKSTWSEPVYIYVPKNGQLEPASITAPLANVNYEWGQDIRLSWTSVTNAESYTYHIKQLSGEPKYTNNESAANSWKGRVSATRRYYTLDGENVQPNTWYKFVVQAQADGYDDSWSKYVYIHIPDREDWIHFVFPKAGTNIEEEAFANNSLLRTFNAAQSRLETIGARAFANCGNLQSINLPGSVSYIADNAFDNCPLLTIHCLKGSYAERYAAERGIPVELHGIIESADSMQLSVTEWNVSTAEAAETVIRTSCSGDWTAETSASWLTLSRTSGADGANVVLRASANNQKISRTAKATFRCGKASAEVTVVQSSISGKECEMELNIDYWEPSSDALSREIVVRSDKGFTVSSDSSWLSYSIYNATITAKVSAGALDSAKQGSLTICCNDCGKERSVTVSIQKQIVPTPTNLNAVSLEPHAISLTWSSVKDATYLIERSADGNSWSQIATASSNSYTDASEINAGTTYWYRVKARKGTANSAPSAAARATSMSEHTLSFNGLLGRIGDGGSVKLGDVSSVSWSTLSGASYKLSLRNLSTNAIVGGLDKYSTGSANSYALGAKLAEGKSYRLWVGAYNAAGRIIGQSKPVDFRVVGNYAPAPSVSIASVSSTNVGNSGSGRVNISISFSNASSISLQLLRNGTPVSFADDYFATTSERPYCCDDFGISSESNMEANSWSKTIVLKVLEGTPTGAYTLRVTAEGSGGKAMATKSLTVHDGNARRQLAVNKAYQWYNYIWKLEDDMTLYNGVKLTKDTYIRGIPYTMYGTFTERYDHYISLTSERYNSLASSKAKGADCTQLVVDCFMTANSEITKRDGMFSKFTYETTWDEIKKGDVVLRKNYPGKSDHVAIIVSVNADGTFVIIENTTYSTSSGRKLGDNIPNDFYNGNQIIMAGTDKSTWNRKRATASGYKPYTCILY